jgi:hypothetical protein
MPSSVSAELDTAVSTVVDLLAGHDMFVPPYAVRDALIRLWQSRNPGLPATQMTLDVAIVDALIADLVEWATAPHPRTVATPAVWTGDAAGRIVTALAMCVHCATFNLDQDRLDVARTLGAASTALATFGSALRQAHLSGHPSLVLIDASTIDYAGAALDQTISAIAVRRWRIADPNRTSTMRLLADAVALLDGPERR